jgi:hypothetical protein
MNPENKNEKINRIIDQSKGGIRRGFPPKGVSIETAREAFASRIRARSKEDSIDLILLDSKDVKFFSLLPLTQGYSDNSPSWIPRFDPVSGSVWTTRLGNIKTGSEYLIFKKPVTSKKVDLDNIPRSWSVKRLIPQEHKSGIESAMRQQDEIAHDYSGKKYGVEYQKVEALLTQIHNLSEIFQKPNLSFNDFGDMATKTVNILKSEIGISTSRDNIQNRIVKSILKSKEKDRLGRVNPMISRIHLRSAYLNAVKQEIYSGFVEQKAKRVYDLLFVERNTTRSLIENAVEAIDELGGFGKNKIGNSILTEEFYRADPAKITDHEITKIINSLKAIVQTSLRQIRVEPYFRNARMAESLLIYPEHLKTNNYNKFEEKPCVESFIRMRKPVEAHVRLQGAYSLLNEVLNDEEYKDIKVF